MQNLRKSHFVVALVVVSFILIAVTSRSAFAQSVPPAPTQRIDRFGVYHWSPDYTAVPPGRDKLNWGSDLVTSMGTRTIRVFLGVQDIGNEILGPYGVNPVSGESDRFHPDYLRNIAASPKYLELFTSNRFDTFLLTVFTQHGYYRSWTTGFLPQGTEWNIEKTQIKNLATYLLDTYPNKKFIILNWEGDADLIFSGNPDANVERWTNYMQARATGVVEARAGRSNPRVFSGIELSCLSMPCGIPGAVGFINEANLVKNYVLPRVTGYDYVSYSAWGTTNLFPGRTVQQLQNDLRSGLRGILAKARESSPAYTSANLIIGEFGYVRPFFPSIIPTFDWIEAIFNVAETEGIAHAIYWQAMDNPRIQDDSNNRIGLHEPFNGQAFITDTGDTFRQLEVGNIPVGNGGFEAPVVGSGGGAYLYNPTGGVWNFAGQSGVSGNNSAFTQFNPNAVEGSQVAFLQNGDSSIISQTISGFQPGRTYQVAFASAQRGYFNDPPVHDFDVMIDNSLLGVFQPVGASYTNFTINFTATSSVHTLKFVGRNSAGGEHSSFIDNVRINALPMIVINGGFEAPVVGSGGGAYLYNPTGGVWNFAGQSGVSGNNSAFTQFNPNAVEGSQVAFLQNGDSSIISQTISGFQPGRTYQVAFASAQRGYFNDPPVHDFDVMIDNSLLGVFQPAGASYTDFTINFTATSSVHTLKFVGRNSAGGEHSSFIDNVRIYRSLYATAIVSCDNSYDMYFNGGYKGSGSLWSQAQTFNLPLQPGKNVVAIKGSDAGGIAALLAEIRVAEQERLGSNVSWKVSLSAPPNWTDVNFDDSGWSNATNYGPYGSGVWGTGVSGMPLDTPAKWIWSSNNDAHDEVYFRFSFDSPYATAIVSCDNSYDMYFNGGYKGSGSLWSQAQTFNLPLQPGKNVVAIKGSDAGGIAALLAEIRVAGQRLGSNVSWKVSLSAPPNWTDVNFDDSGWSNATNYGPYGSGVWGTGVSGMPLDTPAKWIWSSNNDAHDVVYFRFSFVR